MENCLSNFEEILHYKYNKIFSIILIVNVHRIIN